MYERRNMRILILSLLLLFIIGTFGCARPVSGIDGTNGTSCSVESATNGALILCTDGTSSLITNGSNGLNGADGVPGRDGLDGRNGIDSIVDIIDPCGDNPNQFDEVILQLSTGEFLAYFEHDGNRFLSILTNGSYRTTDSQKCSFVVQNGTINY